MNIIVECKALNDVVLKCVQTSKQDTHGAAYDTPVSIVHVNIVECKVLICDVIMQNQSEVENIDFEI